MQRAHVKVQIEVFDVERRGFAGGTLGGVLGSIICSVPSSWPPEAAYKLAIDRESRPGSVVLSRGPHSVYYDRVPGLANWRQSDDRWHTGDRNQYALDILASQVASTLGLPLPPVTMATRLRWLNPEQGRTDLQALATEQREHYADLISGLMRRGLLTSVERTRCPQSTEIEVYDARVDRNQPLPSVAAGQNVR